MNAEKLTTTVVLMKMDMVNNAVNSLPGLEAEKEYLGNEFELFKRHMLKLSNEVGSLKYKIKELEKVKNEKEPVDEETVQEERELEFDELFIKIKEIMGGENIFENMAECGCNVCCGMTSDEDIPGTEEYNEKNDSEIDDSFEEAIGEKDKFTRLLDITSCIRSIYVDPSHPEFFDHVKEDVDKLKLNWKDVAINDLLELGFKAVVSKKDLNFAIPLYSLFLMDDDTRLIKLYSDIKTTVLAGDVKRIVINNRKKLDVYLNTADIIPYSIACYKTK